MIETTSRERRTTTRRAVDLEAVEAKTRASLRAIDLSLGGALITGSAGGGSTGGGSTGGGAGSGTSGGGAGRSGTARSWGASPPADGTGSSASSTTPG